MIIVTGATGFVGRRLIPRLVRKFNSRDIVCLVLNKDSEFELSGQELLHKYHIKYHLVDLENNVGLDDLPDSPEVVIHLAANTDTGTANHRINDIGTKNLFSHFKKLSPKTQVIFTSSAAIMAGRLNCHQVITNAEIPKPTNEYGQSKYRAELYLLALQKQMRFRLTILRPTTIYGANPRNDSMFDFISKNLQVRSPLIRLNWPGKTGFIHVEDVAQTIVNAVGQKSHLEAYNLAAETFAFAQVVKIVCQVQKLKYNQIVLPESFWQIAKKMRPLVYRLEPLFPVAIYNLVWRSTLIVDDVIDCSPSDLKRLKISKPLKLSPTTLDFLG